MPLPIHSLQPPDTIGGIRAISRPRNSTTGVISRAAPKACFSVSERFFPSVLIMSSAQRTVDSAKGRITRIFRVLVRLTQPETATLPGATVRGAVSAVSGEVSSADIPSVTRPSRGIFSPGETIRMSPTFTFSGRVRSAPSAVSTQASWGRTDRILSI